MSATHTMSHKVKGTDSEITTWQLKTRMFLINRSPKRRVRKQPTLAFGVKGGPPPFGAV